MYPMGSIFNCFQYFGFGTIFYTIVDRLQEVFDKVHYLIGQIRVLSPDFTHRRLIHLVCYYQVMAVVEVSTGRKAPKGKLFEVNFLLTFEELRGEVGTTLCCI